MTRLANPFAPRRALPDKTRQVKAWVRELCGLDDAVIGIMRPGEKVETIRIHRPIVEVTRQDVIGAVGHAS